MPWLQGNQACSSCNSAIFVPTEQATCAQQATLKWQRTLAKALTPPDILTSCQGMQSLCRDRDATRQMGMSLRDGSELLFPALASHSNAWHDEQHALKAHAPSSSL